MTKNENSFQKEISEALKTALSALAIIIILAFAIKFFTGNTQVFKGMVAGTLCGYSAFCLLVAGTKKSLLSVKGRTLTVIFMFLRLILFAVFFISVVKNPTINFPATVITCIITYQSFIIKMAVTTLLYGK